LRGSGAVIYCFLLLAVTNIGGRFGYSSVRHLSFIPRPSCRNLSFQEPEKDRGSGRHYFLALSGCMCDYAPGFIAGALWTIPCLLFYPQQVSSSHLRYLHIFSTTGTRDDDKLKASVA